MSINISIYRTAENEGRITALILMLSLRFYHIMERNYDNDAVMAIVKSIVAGYEQKSPRDYIGYITSADSSKINSYKVLINKVEYSIKNGTGLEFKPGDRCLVYCISGNFNNKVIIAKL